MRLLAEPICARRPKSDDPTIGDFATRHFGAEFAQNVLGALITGIFGGDVDRLSLKACFPSIAKVDREHRSLFLHGLSIPFRRIGKPKKPRRRWKGLINFVGGLGAVSDAIARGLGDVVTTNCEVTSVERRGDGYCIAYSASGVSQSLDTRHVVLATPIRQAIGLLETMADDPAGKIAELLASVESVPLVVLNLGFRREEIGHDLKGFGFLVPPKEEGLSILGVLWASSIFPSHAPPNRHLLRVFVGGAKRPELAHKNDDKLVALAMDELRDLLELRSDPVLVNSCRHADAVPQYYPGHTEIVRCIRAQLSAIPNLHLVGNYLEGVSINDCVRQARETVDQMVTRPAEAAALSSS
jgi:oxygen-dependent protoporphyrinogen oxidase